MRNLVLGEEVTKCFLLLEGYLVIYHYSCLMKETKATDFVITMINLIENDYVNKNDFVTIFEALGYATSYSFLLKIFKYKYKLFIAASHQKGNNSNEKNTLEELLKRVKMEPFILDQAETVIQQLEHSCIQNDEKLQGIFILLLSDLLLYLPSANYNKNMVMRFKYILIDSTMKQLYKQETQVSQPEVMPD